MRPYLFPFFIFCSLYLTIYCSDIEPPRSMPSVLPVALCVIRYPVDRLKENDQEYTQYIDAKKSSTGRSQHITRKLSRPNFMQENAASLKKWLELQGISVWDAVRIIESPNFDGRQYKFLNELPHIYLKKRLLVPFEAFLKRFQYQNEMESLLLDYNNQAPFTHLIFSFLHPIYLDDRSVDPFLKVIIQTQSKAFEPCESIYFDAWIDGGISAWRYLKLYFDHSSSPTKNYSLLHLLTSSNYNGLVTFELMKFLVLIESFDPNISVPFTVNGNYLPFFHIAVLDSKYSNTFLPPLLTCKSLDTSVPTGKIALTYKSFEIVYVNEPIIYLAGALFNIWALLHLLSNDKIRSTVQIREFFIFLFSHFIKLIWLSFFTFIRRFYYNNNKS